jgi:hypothetical protein
MALVGDLSRDNVHKNGGVAAFTDEVRQFLPYGMYVE